MSQYRVVDGSDSIFRVGDIVTLVSEERFMASGDFIGFRWYQTEDGFKQILSDYQVEKIA